MKKVYSIEPQRPTGIGWEHCFPADAERFALIELTAYRSGKRKFRKRRVLEVFTDEATANRALGKALAKSH